VSFFAAPLAGRLSAQVPIRALLAGRKTITRRIVNLERLRVRLPRPVRSDLPDVLPKEMHREARAGIHRVSLNAQGAVSAILPSGEHLGLKPGEFDFVCPYAEGATHLGDYGGGRKCWTITPKDSKLWVKETFSACRHGAGHPKCIDYRADGTADPEQKWKSPLFMSRELSRITLEVVSVRIERLNEITEADVYAEGVTVYVNDTDRDGKPLPGGKVSPLIRLTGKHPPIDYLPPKPTGQDIVRANFASLWDQINGARVGASWKANPWIWRVEVRRVVEGVAIERAS